MRSNLNGLVFKMKLSNEQSKAEIRSAECKTGCDWKMKQKTGNKNQQNKVDGTELNRQNKILV